jgi:hypothetical protein|tara:strand:- start:972 stop:1367 length:396 start_codon:yes stop_codon:yes gene_type:complete
MPKKSLRWPGVISVGHLKFKVKYLSPERFAPQAPVKDERAMARIGSHYIYYGYCYPAGDPPIIAVNKDLPRASKLESLIHETLHIVNEQTGHSAKEGAIKRGREEEYVQATASLLTQVLLDNPALSKLLKR